MAVDHVLVEGPFNPTGSGDTPSRRRIFVCHPTRADDEEACAQDILATLASRAYRRSVTDQDVGTLPRPVPDRAGPRRELRRQGSRWRLKDC